MVNCMADISLRRVSKNIIRVWIGCSGTNGVEFSTSKIWAKTRIEKEGILPKINRCISWFFYLLQCWPFFGSLVDMLIFGEGILQIWQLRISPSWNWTEGYTQYSIYNTSYDYPLAATEIWHNRQRGWQSKSNLDFRILRYANMSWSGPKFLWNNFSLSRSTTIHYVDLFYRPHHAKELIIKNAETMPFRLYLGKLSIFVYLGKTLHGKSLCHGFFWMQQT